MEKILQARTVSKRKKIGVIPVQATAKSRRLYKMRGSRAGLQGRPRLGQRLAVQLYLGNGDEDDGGVVRHTMPYKKQKTGAGHSLNKSVASNKRSARKH